MKRFVLRKSGQQKSAQNAACLPIALASREFDASASATSRGVTSNRYQHQHFHYPAWIQNQGFFDYNFSPCAFAICPCKFLEVVATIENTTFHQILQAIALGQGKHPNENSSNFGLVIYEIKVPSVKNSSLGSRVAMKALSGRKTRGLQLFRSVRQSIWMQMSE